MTLCCRTVCKDAKSYIYTVGISAKDFWQFVFKNKSLVHEKKIKSYVLYLDLGYKMSKHFFQKIGARAATGKVFFFSGYTQKVKKIVFFM